jgi:flagellar biosynthetic protein FliR
VRIILSVLLGLVVMTNVTIPDVASFPDLTIFGVIMAELFIGLAAGLILTIMFSAALLAGEKIAGTAGLGLAAQMDPDSGGQTPVVSKTLSLFLVVIFLSWDGHLVILRAVFDTYELLPIGMMPNVAFLVQGGITAVASMFFAAAMLMLPVVVILTAANLGIGVVTRSSPQLNLFSFGFPITMMSVFIILYFWVGSLGLSFEEFSRTAVMELQTVLRGMADG